MGIGNPRQVILVSSEGSVNLLGKSVAKDDIAPVTWHMPVSKEPMLYAISLGKDRFSLKLIRSSKVFIVNFVPHTLRKKVAICGSHSGEHFDKFEKAKLTREEGISVHANRVKEALGHLECEVIKEIDAGDHVILLGRVLRAELKKNGKRLFHLNGNRFTTTLGI